MHHFTFTLILLIGLSLKLNAKVAVSSNSASFNSSLSNNEFSGITGTGCSISFQRVDTDNPDGCSASEDGRICVTINGSVSDDFQLSINNGSTWTSGKSEICIEDLPSGDYTLRIRDQGGCEVEYENNPVTLGVDEPITISDISTLPQTFSSLGSITITATGQSPFQYRIDAGSWQSSGTFSDLEYGTYTVEVKDKNGCVDSDTAIVADERCPAFSVTKTVETNCFSPNGSITFTTSAGIRPITYSIDNGSTWQSDSIFTNLSGGPYQLAVKGDNGCITTSSTTVSTSFIQFSGSSSVVNVSGCMGDATGQISASSFGGKTPKSYSIDNGDNWQSSGDFIGLTAGSYTTIVTDYFGCTDTTIFTITQPNHDTIDYAIVENIFGCAGDSTGIISIDQLLPAPPAYIYPGASVSKYYSIDGGTSWQTSNYFDNLKTGEYMLVASVDGCEYPYFQNPVHVEEPAPIEFQSIDITGDYGNFSGEIDITVTGGSNNYEYSIDDGKNFGISQTFSDLDTGEYALLVRDNHGCTADSTVSVPDWSISIVDVVATDTLECYGSTTGTITITANGGIGQLSYSIDGIPTWQTSNEFSGLEAGDYTIQVKDENDTIVIWASNPLRIFEPDEITIGYRKTNPICTGDSTGQIWFRSVEGGTEVYEFSIDGGISYSTEDTFNNLPAGSYNLQVRDDNGCIKEYTSNPIILIDPAPYEIYDVETTDNTTCGLIGNGIITILEPPIEPAQKQALSETSSTSHYYYSIDAGTTWQEDNGTFEKLKGGSYEVWEKNSSGCIAEWTSNPVEIDNINSIVFDSILVTDDDGRSTGQLEIFVSGGIAPYTYRLDDGIWQSSTLFTSLDAGTYNIQVTDTDGCVKDQNATVDSIVYIPDAIFKAYLIGDASINTNGDSETQVTEARVFTGSISILSLGISDLTGIEAFPNITSLYCQSNALTQLNIKNNTALQTVFFIFN